MKKVIFLTLCAALVGCTKVEQQRKHVEPPPPMQESTPLPWVPEKTPPAPVAPPRIEGKYEGTWVTTNVPLRGRMISDVTMVSGKWRGRFYGVWQGRNFDYNVDWDGTPDRLVGKAVIDGAKYDWTGSITPNSFKGTFTGNRYTGSFDLKR